MSFCPHCSHFQKGENNTLFKNVTEIDLVLSSMVRLRADHQVLSSRLNSLQSATRKLPEEILSSIFLLASPPIDIASRDIPHRLEIYGFFRLGAVCSQWFHIVQSTPQLWSSLALYVKNRNEVAPNLSLLQTFLKNVKKVPFSLQLNLDMYSLPTKAVNHQEDVSSSTIYNPEGFALLAPFYTMIFASPENSRRIRALRMNELPPAWSRISFKDFPILEILSIGDDRNHHNPVRNISDFHTPHLKRIVLENMAFPLNPKDVPYGENITVVDLFRVPVIDCFNFLRISRNVVEFRARETIRLLGGNTDSPPSDNFTMPRLELFEWAQIGDVWDKALLEHIRLPVLHVLGWYVYEYNPEWTWLAEEFFRRLPECLVELKLVGSLATAPHSWHLLTNIRKITILRFDRFSTVRILCFLADNHLFPALREICFVGSEQYFDEDYDEAEDAEEVDASIRSNIRKVILSRWQTIGKEGFCIMTVDHLLQWDLEDIQWMERLSCEKGLNVDVYEDGWKQDFNHIWGVVNIQIP